MYRRPRQAVNRTRGVVGNVSTTIGITELVVLAAFYVVQIRRALRDLDHPRPSPTGRPVRVDPTGVYPDRRAIATSSDDARPPASGEPSYADSPAVLSTGREETALVRQLFAGQIDPPAYRRLMGDLAAAASRARRPEGQV